MVLLINVSIPARSVHRLFYIKDVPVVKNQLVLVGMMKKGDPIVALAIKKNKMAS